MELAPSIFCSGLSEIMFNFSRLGLNSKMDVVSNRLIPFLDLYADRVLKILSERDSYECIHALNGLIENCDNWKAENQIWEEAILLGLIEHGCSNLICVCTAEETLVDVFYSSARIRFKRYGDSSYRVSLYLNNRFVFEVYRNESLLNPEFLIKSLIDELILGAGVYDLTFYRETLYDICVDEIMKRWEFSNGKKVSFNSARVR